MEMEDEMDMEEEKVCKLSQSNNVKKCISKMKKKLGFISIGGGESISIRK